MSHKIRTIHSSLGEVLITAECQEADEKTRCLTSQHVLHNGEIKEVSSVCLSFVEYETCEWTPSSEDYEYYDTSCSNAFSFTNGGKGEGFKYCPYCGNEVEEMVIEVAEETATEKEFEAIAETLKLSSSVVTGGKSTTSVDLTVEVLWSAMCSLRDQAADSIIDALAFGREERIK